MYFKPWSGKGIKVKRKLFFCGRKRLEGMLKEWKSTQMVQRAE
jgi:ribosome maturation factor RimP